MKVHLSFAVGDLALSKIKLGSRDKDFSEVAQEDHSIYAMVALALYHKNLDELDSVEDLLAQRDKMPADLRGQLSNMIAYIRMSSYQQ